MNITRTALVAALLAASNSHAGFFDELKDAVEETAKRTTEIIVVQKTEELIRGMIIGYSSQQTKSNEEVSEEYSRENGSLPMHTKVASYRTEIVPGGAVRPGTQVKVKSYIEVVEGRSGEEVSLEERLTIWDNEDDTVALTSMTKGASRKGGGFAGEFSFELPEGMPQGVYSVSSDLMMNGDLVGDQRHQLQLVIYSTPVEDRIELVAGRTPRNSPDW